MKWSDLGSIVGTAAPLIGSLLGGPAGGAVGGLVASALGAEAKPAAVAEALKADPAALERVRKLELDHQSDLTRMHLEAETARLAEVNKTIRAEIASNDAFVRRWRPTFGYLTAVAWIIQCTAISVSIVVTPESAANVALMVTALTPMWGVALAVLGVNVSKRSQDKQVSAGQSPETGLLGALAKRLAG